MTLPLRRKRLTIAPTTPLQAKGTSGQYSPAIRCRRYLLRIAIATTAAVAPVLTFADNAFGQDGWSPERLPTGSQPRPLGSQPENAWLAERPASAATTPQHAPTQQLGSAVALRWKTPSQPAPSPSAAAAFAEPAPKPAPRPAPGAAPAVAERPRNSTTLRSASRVATGTPGEPTGGASQAAGPGAATRNPLRSSVRPAAYQQQDNPLADPFGDRLPSLPRNAAPPTQLPEEVPAVPQLDFPSLPQSGMLDDPLLDPELAPPPTLPQSNNELDAPPSLPLQDPSPFDRRGANRDEYGDSGAMDQMDGDDGLPQITRGSRRGSDVNCNDLRDRIRDFPITAIDLDVSPGYGVGLRATDRETDERRQSQFLEASSVRQWKDYRGRDLAYGKFIDLRDGRVVLDVDGTQRTIPMRDLSDLDVAYVGSAWNIPTRCGTGYEPLEGRQFLASTVQWTAPGLSHKPLFFEEVQLERYGHTLGPVLQPVVSSVHFFGNIAVLPYKAGIHPPNECQYALGYYRPGDCAPYMMQPIPWSLRGALSQAAVVSGATALIP